MNPYYQPYNHLYSFQHHRRGWICNPTPNYAVFNPQPPVEYVDQVVILNTHFTNYAQVHPLATIDQQQQPPVHSYTLIPAMLEENSILDRYGNFYDPADHRFEADNIWWTIDQEETLVFEEAVLNNNINGTRTGSGLSEETITRRLQASAAAREKIGKGSEEDESDDVCAICLDEYDADEYKKMGRLECGHGYDSECIKTWLLRKNVCPMCKATAFTI